MPKFSPENPSLENLKKQAKALKKEWMGGKPQAIARILAAHPRAVTPRLADCQLVLAREAGFDSWPQLKVSLEAAQRDVADEFVDLACLCYDDPHYDHRSFHARASAMLRDKPWVSEATLWSAATAGNSEAVKAFLDARPESVNSPGPHGWAPLLCACYSRAGPSTLEVAKLLLDRGADPNAYTMKGNADERLDQHRRRFTALTGLFGGGSTGLANQPPHPDWRELAELLLSRGASPDDEQALIINQDACLEILLRHGLNAALMSRALSQAARQGDIDQVRLLLAHHAPPDKKFQSKTPWEHAIRQGRSDIAQLLEEAGASTSDLDDTARFVSMCMAGDERGARQMLEHDSDLMQRAPKDMVHRAVGKGQTKAVKLVLDLGFDPNYQEDSPAITAAGALSANAELLPLLLAHGASLTLRDPWYDSTAVGWADFFNYTELRDKLLNEPGICLFDALDHDRLDRVPDILARDPAALERPFAECLSREPKPEDWQTPVERMMARGKTEAVRVLREHGAS